MLFNLTNQTAFKAIKTDRAIECVKDSGPCFTGALHSFVTRYKDNMICFSEYGGRYESQVDADGFDRLIHRKTTAGESHTDFSITELEVWGVKFSTE